MKKCQDLTTAFRACFDPILSQLVQIQEQLIVGQLEV